MPPSAPFSRDHVRPLIDYTLITRAISHYQGLGYKLVEVPWLVEPETIRLTYQGDSPFRCEAGWLVGSAEQGFLQLALEGALELGQPYVSASPCFRTDDVDATHQKSFFKVELFAYGALMADRFLADAAALYRSLGLDVERLIVGKQIDIMCRGVELGSYGSHLHKSGGAWSYGTGLAEPRTSYVLGLSTPLSETEKRLLNEAGLTEY
jgi:hypothetical protein